MRTFEDVHADIGQALRRADAPALEQYADEMEAFQTDRGLASAWQTRAVASRLTGDAQRALECYNNALRAFEQLGNRIGMAHVYGGMANVYNDIGAYATSLENNRRALDLHEECDDHEGAALVVGNIGGAYYASGNYPEALEHSLRALAIHEQRGDRARIAEVTGNIGNVYLVMGDHARALEFCEQALAMHEELGARSFAALVTNTIGLIHAAAGDHRRALTYHRDALERYNTLGHRPAMVRVMSAMIAAHLALNEDDEAATLLDTVAAPTVGNTGNDITVIENRARIAQRRGDHDDAHEGLHRALAIAIEAGMRPAMARIHGSLRELAKQRNDFAGYILHNDEVQRLNDEIRGQEATRKLAMLEAEKRIAAERAEKERHRTLLYNTLPPAIADRVLRGELVNDSHPFAAVIFMDIVGFTTLSSTMDAQHVVDILSTIFTTCDRIMSDHGIVKIKTIGDSYMAAVFPDTQIDGEAARKTDVAVRAARAALAMLHAVPPNGSRAGSPAGSHEVLQVRIGIHAGPLTAGVIGTERLQYDVWGDTVNVASRMESSGEAGRIHVSSSFALALNGEKAKGGKGERAKGGNGEKGERAKGRKGTINVIERGTIEIKGKGPMTTYWLEGT